MPIATITSKGQITIPKDIRKSLNLHAGDKISFLTDEDGKVSFLPATKQLTVVKGIVPRPDKPVSVEDMKATIRTRGAGDEGT